MKPTAPPVDVLLIILAVVTAAATMDAAGGIDFLVSVAERIIRANPKYITILAPLVTWLFTFLAGTGHVVYPLQPVIYEVAMSAGIRPERPMAVATIASQQSITASPVSAATAAMLGMFAAYNWTSFGLAQILAICVPSTLLGVIVAGFVSMFLGKDLADDPEFQARVKAGLVKMPDPNGANKVLRDVLCKTDNTHRMWNANPEGWKRVAPVLFPLIGKYKDNQSIYNGKVYEMGQHGFARDMEFTLVKHNDDMLVMRLESDENTKEKYPFDFALELEYHLIDNEIKEVYRVINKDNEMMHFSIGGHPAFVTPENDASMAGCKIRFDADRITYHLIGDYQLMARDEYELPLINHEYTIQEDSFEKDAFIIEGSQAGTVSLVKNEKPFVTVKFDTPVFGLWSCKSKNVPFVCIEPWYGRTDAIDFTGELKDREYSNHLDAGEVFEKSFSILFY